MDFILNFNSIITGNTNKISVNKAVMNLKRDLGKACIATDKQGGEICLIEGEQDKESFKLIIKNDKLEIQAADDLGFIYGLYEISRSILGINDFWFWNDQKIVPRNEYIIPSSYQYQSRPYRIRFRGWFVNDEVLLHTWHVNRRKDEPWEMVFEALLRCGGNMVIPGTDQNVLKYREMASKMGLYITHHHAEPLGAEMFARAYPGVNASYDEQTDKFLKLWREGIQEQSDMKVVWNLGFRGQGDYPFWENDPKYQTPESRGELMSKLINIQYEMVKEMVSEAVCCTNLYGETMELYRDGYLSLPDDVIRIWADNGFGKMVTRRQNNHNPRIEALPLKEDVGRHGIYYHVSFYDLQAANHITMLPNSPEFVKNELKQVLEHNAGDYWIINSSNIKPHVYFLDLIANMWRDGDVDCKKHLENYVGKYYGKEHNGLVVECFKDYHKYALEYGTNEDEHAGEQFSNHVARMLVSQYLRDKSMRAEELLWATYSNSLEEQVEWYSNLCQKAVNGYEEYLNKCTKTSAVLSGDAKRLFTDSILLQANIHFHCFRGAYYACKALKKGLSGQFQQAFYMAGKGRKEYLAADLSMRNVEHGKWKDFYKNECLTDVKQTAWVLESLMSYVRNLGDGPHFYHWQRDFLYSEEDKRVMLLLNLENHIKDEELFELMEAKLGE